MADTITRGLDEDKVSEDAKYDGYFCLITSEIDYDYKKILEVYGSLWKIEESFRITKNELETRPIYLSTESHINGHFIICFVALLVIRMLQYKMNFSMSIERIVRALNTSNCLIEEGGSVYILQNNPCKGYIKDKLDLDDSDETIDDFIKIIEAYNINIPFERYKKSNFNEYLESIKY